MPPPARIVRSLKDLRARSGALDQTVVPYKAYMSIMALEMEKSRRQVERRNLIARLKNVTARLRFIETERAAIIGRLDKLECAALQAKNHAPGGFKLRY